MFWDEIQEENPEWINIYPQKEEDFFPSLYDTIYEDFQEDWLFDEDDISFLHEPNSDENPDMINEQIFDPFWGEIENVSDQEAYNDKEESEFFIDFAG